MANVNQMLRKFQFAASIIGLTMGLGMGISGPSFAQTIPLSSSPLQTATTTAVLPNVMFMLDDSGSMAWDYMPDPAANFSGKYGFNSSQCNGMAYNPNINYTPPVTSTGATLNSATPTTFTAAYLNGYNTGLGTVNLNTQFTGGSGSGSSGEVLAPGPAFYYTYSGTQTLPVQQNYFNTNGTFYKECNSNIGSAPGNAVFSKTTLSSTVTTTITVNSNITTITVGGSGSSSVSGITVGGVQILSATTTTTASTSTLAAEITAYINLCTYTTSGHCVTAGGTGYSAVNVPGSNVVTLYGPADNITPVITKSGSMTVTTPGFPDLLSTQVTSIKVNGTNILSGSTTTSSISSTVADNIVAKVSAVGYSATAIGTTNVVTLTGPASAAGYTPIITACSTQAPISCYTTPAAPSAGVLGVSANPFPSINTAQLQNFANWYSYYSHRMISMKTVAGQAFAPINSSYRVGFMTMNNNVPPDFVNILPFNAAQKATWYSTFYAAIPSNGTPLRDALSHVGQLYAHKIGSLTKYTSTITVTCSNGASSGTCPATDYDIVDGITVWPTTGTLNDSVSGSLIDSGTSANCPADPVAPPLCSSAPNLAASIANAINAMVVSDYGATVSGNVVTIYGPAPALGIAPHFVDSSPMVQVATAFTSTTTTDTLNGVVPLDPVQYSCQENFVILDTDGYWNTGSTWDMNNTANGIGNADGTASYTVAATAQTWGPEPRPMLDATNTSNTLADVAEYYYQTDLRDPGWGNQFGAPITTVNAGSFVVGQHYSITSVGTTNFTAIGAGSNTIGIIFTATGAGWERVLRAW